MSAAPGGPMLRARIAHELGELLDTVPLRQLGARLGCAGTTVARRGADLEQWPARDLIELAATCPDLANAIVCCLRPPVRAETGRPTRATSALLAEMREDGELITAISAALADGRISPAEAKDIAGRLRARRDHVGRLLLDLDALSGAARA
jgi:hypothetical protein